MGIYSIKPAFQKQLIPIQNILIKSKVSPNSIVFSAFAISLLAGYLLYSSHKNSYFLLIVPLIAFARTALNALDGMIARTLKISSKKGEVLNEQFDRFSDVAIFLGASFAGLNYLLGSICVILILLNSYISILSKAAGASRQYGGIMGKADRMIVLSIACVAVFITSDFKWFNYMFIVIAVGTVLTFSQRFMKTMSELN